MSLTNSQQLEARKTKLDKLVKAYKTTWEGDHPPETPRVNKRVIEATMEEFRGEEKAIRTAAFSIHEHCVQVLLWKEIRGGKLYNDFQDHLRRFYESIDNFNTAVRDGIEPWSRLSMAMYNTEEVPFCKRILADHYLTYEVNDNYAALLEDIQTFNRKADF